MSELSAAFASWMDRVDADIADLKASTPPDPIPPDPTPIPPQEWPYGTPASDAMLVHPGDPIPTTVPEIILTGHHVGRSFYANPGQTVWLDKQSRFDGDGRPFLVRSLADQIGPRVLQVIDSEIGFQVGAGQFVGPDDGIHLPGYAAEVYGYDTGNSQRAVIDARDPDWPQRRSVATHKGLVAAGFTIRDNKGECLHKGGREDEIVLMELLRPRGSVVIGGHGTHPHIDRVYAEGGGVTPGGAGHESGIKPFAEQYGLWENFLFVNSEGPGLWHDGHCIDTTVRDGRIMSPAGPGFFGEISFGGTMTDVEIWDANNGGFGSSWGGGAVLLTSAGAWRFKRVKAYNSRGGVRVVEQNAWRDVDNYPEYLRELVDHRDISADGAVFEDCEFKDCGAVGRYADQGAPLPDVQFTNTLLTGHSFFENEHDDWS